MNESFSEVAMRAGRAELRGLLAVPALAAGLAIFVHGSGSGRHSPRNQAVARVLRQNRFGTLLFDLLTEEEERGETAHDGLRFDIRFLADRLLQVTHWVRSQRQCRSLPTGYFGASTGAAAALVAAAALPQEIGAVVSRGGRPDLAGASLARVRAPTLLIVGGNDAPVIRLNQIARDGLRCERALTIVPGATHLFEEPGTLETVAQLAANWFVRYLPAPVPAAP